MLSLSSARSRAGPAPIAIVTNRGMTYIRLDVRPETNAEKRLARYGRVGPASGRVGGQSAPAVSWDRDDVLAEQNPTRFDWRGRVAHHAHTSPAD
jgi:hypothetical protein